MKKTSLLLAVMIGLALGHSWLACSDYRGDVSGLAGDYNEDQCFGYGRDWTSNNLAGIGSFGSDRGYNYQPGGGRTCRDALDGNNDYTDDFPRAQYVQGSTIRLLWPAKNHARVRDFGTKIFACCGADCTDALENDVDLFAMDEFLVADFGTNTNGGDIGFGNCPDISNTDRAVCFGDIEVSSEMEGECTFLWYWPFNSDNDVYTTCWEADVFADGIPTTQAPTEAPTEAPEDENNDGGNDQGQDRGQVCEFPVADYGQCGGINFSGSTCCASDNFGCFAYNAFYSQCIPNSQISAREEGTDAGSSGVSGAIVGVAVGATAIVTAGLAYMAHRRSVRMRSMDADGVKGTEFLAAI